MIKPKIKVNCFYCEVEVMRTEATVRSNKTWGKKITCGPCLRKRFGPNKAYLRD